ncbi:S1C family serine protease [Actinophytocola oryzae]|uniref:Putative serine protease PepD n=1 Tax=Actinophytocola oryzae TaxID=502181 RepID=A0A4R7V8Z4_9PSEU|nr:trypsin-like peptidase domain-containing protein [Actinophytocola oryzae]TDV45369.1 putative serine protease PepD [Actinophytocola oryzae]
MTEDNRPTNPGNDEWSTGPANQSSEAFDGRADTSGSGEEARFDSPASGEAGPSSGSGNEGAGEPNTLGGGDTLPEQRVPASGVWFAGAGNTRQPGPSGDEPAGRVAGTPGGVSGPPPGVTWHEGIGVPPSEWSAGAAHPQQNQWARPTEQVVYGTAAPGGPTPPGGNYLIRPSQPQPHPQPQPQQQKRGSAALVIGVAVLALFVGGGAGALGGYLASDNGNNAPVTNALDQQPPADHTSSSPSGTVEAVAEKVSPSVVQLQVEGRNAAGEGSGFIISSDGLIVTNNHVVEVAAKSGKITAVFSDGSTASATVVGRDPTSDVAVVKADGKTGLPVVDLGSSDALKVGQGVVAIGSPFELSGTVTSGIVSSLHRPTRAGGEDGSQATVMDAIQTDAAINPGNSGGPLVNMAGQVIGINSAIYSPQTGGGSGQQAGSIGIGFAIPIDQARRTADEIVKTGKATQTILGVSVRDNQGGGALIVDVTAGGPGAQAGLKTGDVVTKLDDRHIDTSDALVAAVRSHKPGDKVRLELSNGSRTVEATLAGQTVETE